MKIVLLIIHLATNGSMTIDVFPVPDMQTCLEALHGADLPRVKDARVAVCTAEGSFKAYPLDAGK